MTPPQAQDAAVPERDGADPSVGGPVGGNEWRRVMASLADPVRRAVFAELVLDEGTPVTPRSRERALRELTAAGIVTDGRIDLDHLRRLLAANAPKAASGIDRWVRDGRIVRWPVREVDHEELLRWAVSALPGGESDAQPAPLSEQAVTDALAQVTDDPVLLRRYLVDGEYLIRSRDGAVYRIPARP